MRRPFVGPILIFLNHGDALDDTLTSAWLPDAKVFLHLLHLRQPLCQSLPSEVTFSATRTHQNNATNFTKYRHLPKYTSFPQLGHFDIVVQFYYLISTGVSSRGFFYNHDKLYCPANPWCKNIKSHNRACETVVVRFKFRYSSDSYVTAKS